MDLVIILLALATIGLAVVAALGVGMIVWLVCAIGWIVSALVPPEVERALHPRDFPKEFTP